MRPSTPPSRQKYSDCLALFLKYSGTQHARIEREMRGLGHGKFSRRILYSRFERGVRKPGWIARYDWKQLLSEPGAGRGPQSGIPTGVVGAAGGAVSSMPSVPSMVKETTNSKFPDWLKRVSPAFHWDWCYQELIYEKLAAVTRGECKRLMLFLPPRHGKSELVTVRYAAWRLEQDPSLNIILGSYNQRLANRFSRKIRNTLAEAQMSEPGGDRGPQSGIPAGVADETGSLSSAETQSHRAQGGNTGRSDCVSSSCQHTEARKRQASGTTVCPKCLAANSASSAVKIMTKQKAVNSAEEWETRDGGGVRAVGVGAGVTGFGAKLVIIDDPVRSRADAESKTHRTRVWDWFNDDLYTRLEPDGAIILIQTRWHEDDLSGRLIKEMQEGGEHWDVVSLPALAEPMEITNDELRMMNSETGAASPLYLRKGSAFPVASQNNPGGYASVVKDQNQTTEHTDDKTQKDKHSISAISAFKLSSTPHSEIHNSLFVIRNSHDPLGRPPGAALCPQRFNVAALLKIKRKLGSYSFSALYQQRPTPPEGGLFKRDWFQTIDHAPPDLIWKRGYDLAVSTRTSADYTASFRCAFDRLGNLYIADGFRKRIEFPEQRRYIAERLRREPSTEHGIESALHGQAFVQDLRRIAGHRANAFRAVRVVADKFTRALAWANLAEERKVFLVRGPWIRDFIEEAASFPNAKHDDQIDAVSLAVQMLSTRNRKAFGF